MIKEESQISWEGVWIYSVKDLGKIPLEKIKI
jgi:hypothetical protein